MKVATGKGEVFGASFAGKNHDVPTDPEAIKAYQLATADALLASAKAKVERQKQHLSTAPKDKKARQRAHLKGAQDALAQAIAARKGL